MSLLLLGSLALDTIRTPQHGEAAHLLGGTASYAVVSASLFTKTHLLSIVGEDFPEEYLNDFKKREIDLQGLQIVPGKSFRWSAEYAQDMNERRTLSTELNVFANFIPTLPEHYRQLPFVLLANIGPDLQAHVLDALQSPRFVMADTMDLWINIARKELLALLKRIDLLSLNESEARALTGERNLIRAGQLLCTMGPKYVVLKKGEHGCFFFAEDDFFVLPAFPLEEVMDPTGAGDSFIGAFAGYLASRTPQIDQPGVIKIDLLRQAAIHGTLMASFTVEAFGLDRLRHVTRNQLEERLERFEKIIGG